jgi:hypothetical protein
MRGTLFISRFMSHMNSFAILHPFRIQISRCVSIICSMILAVIARSLVRLFPSIWTVLLLELRTFQTQRLLQLYIRKTSPFFSVYALICLMNCPIQRLSKASRGRHLISSVTISTCSRDNNALKVRDTTTSTSSSSLNGNPIGIAVFTETLT